MGLQRARGWQAAIRPAGRTRPGCCQWNRHTVCLYVLGDLMKPARRTVLVATLLMLIPQPQGWAGDGGPIVVIVNQANPVPNLTVADLRKIFLSDRSRWETGKSVAPVIPPTGSP